MTTTTDTPGSDAYSRPAILTSSASLPLRGKGAEVSISVEQAWKAILRWVRGDSNFVPKFVQTEVISEDDMQIVKRVQYFAGSDNMPPKREQITRLYPGYLAVTRYSDGPFFLAMAGIDLTDQADPKLFLTTIRHTQDPLFRDPAEAARERGMPPPGGGEQNLARVLDVIRRLIAEGNL
jgi:hypothetical protein